MAFVDQTFPEAISYGAIERLRHSTSVIEVDSGARSANKNWAFPLREFDVSHAMRIKSTMDTLVAFNLAIAEGRANSFRYKAWGDFRATSGQGVLTELTANTTWQMWRRYTFGGVTKDRKITLPVAASITIAGGGTYSLAATTGIITRTAGANPTGWTGDYNVQVAFGTDLAEYAIHTRGPGGDFLMRNENILLHELR